MILHYRDNFDKFVRQMRFFNFFANFHCFTPDESFDDVITLIMTSSKIFFRQNIFRYLDYVCAKFGWYCISGSWFTQGGHNVPPPSISVQVKSLGLMGLRKLYKYGKRGNFGYFRSKLRANKNFPKLVHYVSLKYLSTSNFM